MTATDTTTDTTAVAGRGEGLSREILVLAGVVILGTIMTVLDLTVVNVAIPTLARDLGASIPAIQWVMTGYTLAFATVIPLTGWAAERFGARRAWIFALLLFLAGSVLAGMSLASVYAVGDFLGRELISIPLMARLHGVINSFGFALCGFISWTVAQPGNCFRASDRGDASRARTSAFNPKPI